ncbi:hypothetical protein E2562_031314 [Oryza meyeriana var. granulata]|uniref:Uncharacterized protein n=1 Tax=Oryza meyeriana var. granulata TaxID=110450 RepID=A0A6G1CB33_9ORYZ|nr:hypothetical protein E2562_031314 [Oryza meyeriana var. granulata]
MACGGRACAWVPGVSARRGAGTGRPWRSTHGMPMLRVKRHRCFLVVSYLRTLSASTDPTRAPRVRAYVAGQRVTAMVTWGTPPALARTAVIVPLGWMGAVI